MLCRKFTFVWQSPCGFGKDKSNQKNQNSERSCEIGPFKISHSKYAKTHVTCLTCDVMKHMSCDIFTILVLYSNTLVAVS